MYLLFDIGGTKTRLATSLDKKSLTKTIIVPTPKKFKEALKILDRTIGQLVPHRLFEACAGGVPGTLDPLKEKLLRSFNLQDWVGKPLRKELLNIVGEKVYLENDADLAGLGEAVYGAGRNFKIVSYITVGTGVGGTRIVNKKIDKKKWGFEPGYQVIDIDSSIDPSFFLKKSRYKNDVVYLQRLISGRDIKDRLKKYPHEITDKKIWRDIEKWLAAGLNNTIVHWSPDVVILGGGLIENDVIELGNIKSHLKEILNIFPEIPEIKKAELGNFGGLFGALEYLNQRAAETV